MAPAEQVQDSTETLKLRNMVVTWDPRRRLVERRNYSADTLLEADAEIFIGALNRWEGGSDSPIGILLDSKDSGKMDPGYRYRMFGYFRSRGRRAFIAIFNAGSALKIMAEMFRIATGVEVRVFKGEDEARAWLGENGINA